MLKVWLDDWECWPNDPRSWVHCHKVGQVKILLERGLVTTLSLDHDLGADEPTGYDLCKWMGETGHWPKDPPLVHSGNPVGAENMLAYIERYYPKG